MITEIQRKTESNPFILYKKEKQPNRYVNKFVCMLPRKKECLDGLLPPISLINFERVK